MKCPFFAERAFPKDTNQKGNLLDELYVLLLLYAYVEECKA